LARKSALTYKAKESVITVLEDFNFDLAKTKNYISLMKNLKLNDKKTLLVLAESNNSIYLSARNLSNTKVITASEVNTYDVLNANNLVLTEGSVKLIENLLN